MGTIDPEKIEQRRRQTAEISLQLQDASLCLREARARLDEAAALLAVVDYVLLADATNEETTEVIKDVFEQIEFSAAQAAGQAQQISNQLPSDRDLRRTFARH
jgi:hypothetical protein